MVVFTTFCFRSVRSHTGLGACKLAKCDAFIESAKEPRSEYVCAVTVDSLMLTRLRHSCGLGRGFHEDATSVAYAIAGPRSGSC